MAKNYGIFYVNVGDGETRTWEDMKQYDFISAGQGDKYSKPLKALNIDDIVLMYLKGSGYVAIAKVTKQAVAVNEFMCKNGQSLTKDMLINPGLFQNSDDSELSEWLVEVEWIKSVNREDGKWRSGTVDGVKIYSTPLIKASMENQQGTIDFLNEEFNVDIRELAGKSDVQLESENLDEDTWEAGEEHEVYIIAQDDTDTNDVNFLSSAFCMSVITDEDGSQKYFVYLIENSGGDMNDTYIFIDTKKRVYTVASAAESWTELLNLDNDELVEEDYEPDSGISNKFYEVSQRLQKRYLREDGEDFIWYVDEDVVQDMRIATDEYDWTSKVYKRGSGKLLRATLKFDPISFIFRGYVSLKLDKDE
jgi:hypothetical protein